MKKLFKSKKTLSIIAGVLATVSVIGAGTWAWFTDSARTGEAEFTTGRLDLIADEGGYRALNFVNGIQQNIDQIKTLEDSTYTEANLEAWLRYFDPDRILSKDEYDGYNGQVPFAIEEYEAKLADFNEKWTAFDNFFSQDLADALFTANLAQSMMPPVPADIMTYEEWLAAGGTKANWPMPEDFNYRMNYLLELNIQWNLYNGFLASLNAALANLEAVQNLTDAEKEALRLIAYEANILMWEAYYAMQALAELAYGSIVLEETNIVTPASLILGSYSFVVDSDIPAYFRVAAFEEMDDNVVALAIAQFSGDINYALVDGGDGYLYCPVAVNDGDVITIKIGAYIYGAANDNDVQSTSIEFGETGVEIIQATNNAAYIFWDTHDLPLYFFQ